MKMILKMLFHMLSVNVQKMSGGVSRCSGGELEGEAYQGSESRRRGSRGIVF